ncbi:MAG: 16S rRNA (guanine(527)-N(7))-methyltransferase RsmG [Moorellales bacterium]
MELARQREFLEAELARQGAFLVPQTIERLMAYGRRLLAANRSINLTGARTWEQLVEEHLVDCAVGVSRVEWEEVRVAVDVGSGGGLPGLVLALMKPELRLRLVEARRKRAEFLRRCAGELGLERVEVVAARVEELAHRPDWREAAERVTARGVAPLAVLVEYALPLLARGGWLLAWKGPAVGEELAAAQAALRVLGGRVRERYPYRLAGGRERWLVVVEKVGPTPEEYPRRAGLPERRPLGG